MVCESKEVFMSTFQKASVQRVVIRLPNWIGDAVMAAPVIRGIVGNYPEVDLLGNGSVIDLYREERGIRNFLLLKEGREMRDILAKNCYDLGVLLTNSFSSAYLFRRARIPYRVGLVKDFRSFLLNRKEKYPTIEEHMTDTYRRILRLIGSENKEDPELLLTEEERIAARENLMRKGVGAEDCLIGINPGAAFGPGKCWPEENFYRLGKKLLENPKNVLIFFGDRNGEEKVKRITDSLSGRVINLAGKTTIREFMAYIRCCHLFLTNDSGPMHVACALGVRTLALFGSTSPERTGPYRSGAYLYKKVSCSPCFRRVCPIDFKCMRSLSPEEVCDRLILLGEGKDVSTEVGLCR